MESGNFLRSLAPLGISPAGSRFAHARNPAQITKLQNYSITQGLTMRHQRATKKLGRNTSHRRALLRNLVTSLIMEERIETTPAKAKAMRPHVEKMITLGKRGDVAARRLALGFLMTRESVERLFDTVAPRFGDRNGGYLRIIQMGWRTGD